MVITWTEGRPAFPAILGVCLSQLSLARAELRYLEGQARRLCPPGILPLALDSLHNKAFHSIGGSVYACAPGVPAAARRDLTATIVALQTLSDYLDTLVDRSSCTDQCVHERLHRAFTDAVGAGGGGQSRGCGAASTGPRVGPRVEPRIAPASYFDGFPLGYDGGYLELLVRRVRGGTARLPAYRVVADPVMSLATLYGEMQSRKHTAHETRERSMDLWYRERCRHNMTWWEFGAAAGSTLGVFALLALAAGPGAGAPEAVRVAGAYFPYVCALHIMLDYLVDREEDHLHGDLNFTVYYDSLDAVTLTLSRFFTEAEARLGALDGGAFHLTVLRGLPALYFSDPKVRSSGLDGVTVRLLGQTGVDGARFFSLCRVLRRLGAL
ncbi:MAG: DUF2600 family protein [Firmicutes bacterium]|nr:DUF2600 family protein [Bacillota bacterium]